jgi:hypothetical protein
MKISLQITMKNQTSKTVEALVKKTDDTFIKVHELQNGTSPLFIKIEHQQINTLLELSKVSPFVLLYFDDKLQFTGATYSLNGYDSPFGISTMCKNILLLNYPISFQLEEVASLTLIK